MSRGRNRSGFPSSWSGRRIGGSRRTRARPGVDGESIEQFEADLKGNLYKLWNRMSSGSYFPPPVRMVEIPKPGWCEVRILGVPTVADRIAQTVAAMVPGAGGGADVPSGFLRVSAAPVGAGRGGGVPGSDAGGPTGWLTWTSGRSSTTSITTLLIKAVARHTGLPWVLLYVRRWLTAPMQRPDGELVSAGIAAAHRAPRFRRCWRTCSCTTRSMRGWPGSFRPSGSNGTAMTWWSTAAARPRHNGSVTRSRPGWPSAGLASCIRDEDPDRVLQGRATGGLGRARAVHVPRLHIPARGWPKASMASYFFSFSPAVSRDRRDRIRR